MANMYDKWTDEQRIHWNQYNSAYAKRNYFSVNVKLNIKDDAEMINYLRNSGVTTSSLIRAIVKMMMASGINPRDLVDESEYREIKTDDKGGTKDD